MNVITSVVISCYKCGLEFAVSQQWEAERQRDHATLWCPNGHPQHFSAENREEKLERQLRWMETRLQGETRRAEAARRSAAAQKGVVTKLRKRLGEGLCPYCDAHFPAIGKHMQEAHPEAEA